MALVKTVGMHDKRELFLISETQYTVLSKLCQYNFGFFLDIM